MNYTLVVLGTILGFILLILYKVFSDAKTKLASSKKFSTETHNYSNLSDPESVNYYVALWIYISGLPATNQVIFDISNNNETLSVTVESSSILNLNIKGIAYKITDSIPIQQWTYIIISVTNNSLVDSYLDGKLIKSQALTVPVFNVNSTLREGGVEIVLSCKGSDIARFERIPQAITPDEAWNKYMAGNSSNSISQFLSDYGITFVLTKDAVDHKKISFAS
jgi:hypothetical protein